MWHWTTERDCAEFAAAIIERDGAENGGYWTVASGVHSLKEIVAIYQKVRGTKVGWNAKGSIEELRKEALEAQKKGNRQMYWEYIGWLYYLYIIDGSWKMSPLENEKLGVKGTTLEQYLDQNPQI